MIPTVRDFFLLVGTAVLWQQEGSLGREDVDGMLPSRPRLHTRQQGRPLPVRDSELLQRHGAEAVLTVCHWLPTLTCWR